MPLGSDKPGAGYASSSLAKKLGIKERYRVVAVGAPAHYRPLLEPLPPVVGFVAVADRSTDLVHCFHTRKVDLSHALTTYRLDPTAIDWVSWPKKSAGVPSELTEDGVREIGFL